MPSSASESPNLNLALSTLQSRRNTLRFLALACGCNYREEAHQELAAAQARVDQLRKQMATFSGYPAALRT